MSKLIELNIVCNGSSKECEGRIFHEHTKHSAAYQRREGAKRGWIYTSYGGKDYCPACLKHKKYVLNAYAKLNKVS